MIWLPNIPNVGSNPTIRRILFTLAAVTMVVIIFLGTLSKCAPSPSPPGPHPPPEPGPTPPAPNRMVKVIGVEDGDTFIYRVRLFKKARVDLAYIDAPEMDQPYGPEAKEWLTSLIQGKEVRVEAGKVFIPVEQSQDVYLNYNLTWLGLCWVTPDCMDSMLRDAEAEAREARRGLWKDRNAIPPWTWRADQLQED